LGKLAERLNGKVPVSTLNVDLTKIEDRKILVEKIHKEVPDLIINCAGIGLYGDALTHETKKQMEIFETNSEAVFETTLEGSRALISNKSKGVILNISSLSGFLIYPSFSIYAASKAFVTQFSRSLDYEVKAHNLRVLVACPGRINSSFLKRASGSDEDLNSWFAMSPKYAAKKLLKQIEERKQMSLFDWKAKPFSIFMRFFIPKRLAAFITSSSIKKFYKPRPIILKRHDS